MAHQGCVIFVQKCRGGILPPGFNERIGKHNRTNKRRVWTRV